jgi:hypothetical protein
MAGKKDVTKDEKIPAEIVKQTLADEKAAEERLQKALEEEAKARAWAEDEKPKDTA